MTIVTGVLVGWLLLGVVVALAFGRAARLGDAHPRPHVPAAPARRVHDGHRLAA